MMPRPKYRCSYGPCTRNTKPIKSKSLNGPNDVTLVYFPSPKTEVEKCKRWVSACGRSDFSIREVSKASQICARHFHGFRGPTAENRDPVPLIDVLTPGICVPYPSKTSISSEVRNQLIELDQPCALRGEPDCSQELSLSSSSLEIKEPTNEPLLKRRIDIHSLTYQVGWSIEVLDDSVRYSKLKNGSTIIQCTFSDNDIIIESIDKSINIQTISPNFNLIENQNVYDLLNKLNKFNVCIGNPDKEMVALFKRQNKFNRKKTGYYCEKTQTIFSNGCSRLIKAGQVKRCHGGCLGKIRSNANAKLAVEETKTKSRKLIDKRKATLSNCQKTKAAISTMKEAFQERLKMEPTVSFTSLFLKQQLKAMSRSKYGMKWDKTFLKWCCYLKKKSKSSYEALRKSGCINLPTSRTLYNERQVVTTKSGFQPEIFSDMIKKTKLHDRENWDCYFVILLDEIKIREDLMCHKDTGFLTGFKDINVEINRP